MEFISLGAACVAKRDKNVRSRVSRARSRSCKVSPRDPVFASVGCKTVTL